MSSSLIHLLTITNQFLEVYISDENALKIVVEASISPTTMNIGRQEKPFQRTKNNVITKTAILRPFFFFRSFSYTKRFFFQPVLNKAA